MHHGNNVEDDKQKPEIIHFYNRTKRGVNKWTNVRCTNRWRIVIFFYQFNVCGINSFVIYKSKVNSNISRKVFLKDLAVNLVKSHQMSRVRIATLPRPLQKRLKRIHEVDGHDSSSGTIQPPSYKRWYMCQRTKDRKRKTTYSKRQGHVCNEHMIVVCQNCDGKDWHF